MIYTYVEQCLLQHCSIKEHIVLSVLISQISNLFHSFLLIYTPNVFGL